MASFTIPEDIIPGALYVPNDNEFFEITSGGMPNGDDCLRCRGDINPRYKAFQQPVTVSPDIFNSRVASGWAMSFWAKTSAITIANAGCQSDKMMFGMMSRNASNPKGFGYFEEQPSATGTNAATYGMLWAVTARAVSGGGSSQNKIGFIRQRTIRAATTSAGGRSDIWDSGSLTTGWNQIIINFPVPTGTAPYGFVNTTRVDGYVTGSFDGTLTTVGPLYFCIGSYSDTSLLNGRADDWSIGKLAFHDTLLTLTDAALMYNDMVNA